MSNLSFHPDNETGEEVVQTSSASLRPAKSSRSCFYQLTSAKAGGTAATLNRRGLLKSEDVLNLRMQCENRLCASSELLSH